MNPERLLGGLLKMGMRSTKKMDLGTKAALGMGAVGIAMAAFEHFSQPQSAAPAGYPASPYPPSSQSGSSPVPPPSPGTVPATPPPPPGSMQSALRDQQALLLIRAMIAAANADGMIDQQERSRILEKFQNAGLNDEKRTFILNEMFSPADVHTIAAQVTHPDLARQVYAVSLLAIEADTSAEQTYLQTLAQKLGLKEDEIQEIQRMIE